MSINNSLNNTFITDYNGLNKLSKNIIIGGNFTTNPWQRGVSFVTPLTGAYTADRFKVDYVTTATTTITQAADSPTETQAFIFSTQALSTAITAADAAIAAGDFYIISQAIEGYNFTNIAQRAFTLSFWVKSVKTGIYCVSFRNSGSDRSYVAEYTINTTNTWEKKTITVTASPSAGTWDYTTGVGLSVSFALACGATFQTTANAWQTGNFYGTANQVNGLDSNTNVFILALIQIESGEVATPFEQRMEAEIIKDCQRYFQKTFPMTTAPAQASGTQLGAIQYRAILTGIFANGQTWDFASIMRVAPTITYFNPISANTNWYNVTLAADSGASSSLNIGDRAAFASNAQVVGDTATNNITIHATASAEL